MPSILRKVAVLCINSEGSPEFHLCAVSVTHQQMICGEHYELAKDDAEAHGYEPPMIAFDEDDEAAQRLRLLAAHFAGSIRRRPRCLVVVSDGVADPVSDDDVEVQVFDWDNYRDENRAGQMQMRVPPHFRDLAERCDIPVKPA